MTPVARGGEDSEEAHGRAICMRARGGRSNYRTAASASERGEEEGRAWSGDGGADETRSGGGKGGPHSAEHQRERVGSTTACTSPFSSRSHSSTRGHSIRFDSTWIPLPHRQDFTRAPAPIGGRGALPSFSLDDDQAATRIVWIPSDCEIVSGFAAGVDPLPAARRSPAPCCAGIAASSLSAGEHGSPPSARPCPSVQRLLRLSGTDFDSPLLAFAVDLVDDRAQRLSALTVDVDFAFHLVTSPFVFCHYTRSRVALSPFRLRHRTHTSPPVPGSRRVFHLVSPTSSSSSSPPLLARAFAHPPLDLALHHLRSPIVNGRLIDTKSGA
ncbi:hypothetical protein C8R45DRAFT_1212408 [Mycena sanguinolenta]|nr:hypothetical protein C8R45DRAFT_1212408 [Mycena sanguinolenta]